MTAPPSQERVKFWRDSALQDLEMLLANYITHSFSRHTHDGYAIGVITFGVEEFYYRGAIHQAQPGDIVVIQPGEVHTGHAGVDIGWSYRMLYPSVGLMQKTAASLGRSLQSEPYFSEAIIRNRPLAEQFCRLHKSLEHSDSCLERESRFFAWMARLIDLHSDRAIITSISQPRATPLIAQVRDYLHQHYSEAISLDELAQLTQLNPLKLLRSFRQVTGLPPHAYLVQIRVQQAKQQLAAGRAIATVALETGFSDQSHLNRHFKRLVGVTPGQYVRGKG